MAEFAEREIEVRATMMKATLTKLCAVTFCCLPKTICCAMPLWQSGQPFDLRSFCIIRKHFRIVITADLAL
jgi:hypothetical protein